jgi:pimeloyl-ACP methyl ester carboxylesterase
VKRARLAPDERLPEIRDGLAWPGEAVELDGSVTYVRRLPGTAPRAEPALYVHGLGGSSLNWTDLGYLLADRFDGQAIDLPGFGHSDPARSYGIPAAADRVIRWIEVSGRHPVHLVGNSLGGAISVRVAGLRPDLVRTLTLISPAMPFMDPRRSVQSRFVPLALLPGAARIAGRRMAAIAPELMVAQVVAACFAQPNRISPQRLADAIDEFRARYTVPWFAGAYVGTMRGLVGSFVRAYLPGPNSMWRIAQRVAAPTLVLTGRQDRLVDVRVAPTVAKLIPDSRLILFDGVGHVAQMEQPRLVARAILGMLDERAAAPTTSV